MRTPHLRPDYRVALVLFLGLSPSGCEAARDVPTQTPPEPARAQASIRDSAGVRIVENEEGSWLEGERWTLSPDPELRIGTVDGDEHYLFERVIGAVTLSDGRILVADAGGPRLKAFDRFGEWIRDVGRPGEGPGEFSGLNLMRRLEGDSVFVFDWSGHRYTVFGPDLEPARIVPLSVDEPGIGPPHIKAVTEGGTAILVAAKPPWVEDPLQWYGQPGHMFVEEGEGHFSGEVARFPGQGNLWKTHYATLGETLLVLPTGSFAVDAVDLAGRTVRSIRRGIPGSPIPPEFFEPRSEGPLATLTHEDGRVIAMTAQDRDPAAYPPTLPVVDQILTDRSGKIWVRHYAFDEAVPGDSPFQTVGRDPLAAQVFSVFRDDGQFLGEVEVPAGREVLEIGEDWVLARSLDEYDVQFVERYRLLKPAGG